MRRPNKEGSNLICILNPQRPRSTPFLSEQEIIQGHSESSDVEIASGRGPETETRGEGRRSDGS